jgi:prepilin-type N-terminal cleavage/methylation domain-containing protein
MQRSFQPNIAARQNAFTLIELLVVIAIIGVLASLIVGLAGLAGRKSKEAQVRAQLNQYITAIERYKSEFGYYPPDNAIITPGNPVPTTNVNPGINQLYYELAGVVVNNQQGTFQSPNNPTPITAASVLTVFHRDGFVHAAIDPKELKSLVSNWKANQVQTVPTPPNGLPFSYLVVPVPIPTFKQTGKRDPSAVFPQGDFESVNPWRYVSTNPTNNPASFDLWAVIPITINNIRTNVTIGNWKE